MIRREKYKEYVGIALACADFAFIIFLVLVMGRLNKEVNEERGVNDRRDEASRKAHMQAKGERDLHNDLIAKLTESAAFLSRRVDELERRLHCVEEDLEKIPVEEVNAEVQRLELFNDGIANIMGYGPDVPKLNKEVLKHE